MKTTEFKSYLEDVKAAIADATTSAAAAAANEALTDLQRTAILALADDTASETAASETEAAAAEPGTKKITKKDINNAVAGLRSAYNALKAEALKLSTLTNIAVRYARNYGNDALYSESDRALAAKSWDYIQAIATCIGIELDVHRYEPNKVARFITRKIADHAPYRFAAAANGQPGEICTLRQTPEVTVAVNGLAVTRRYYVAVKTNPLQILIDTYKAVKYGVKPIENLVEEVSKDRNGKETYTYYNAELATLSANEKKGMPKALKPINPNAAVQVRYRILNAKDETAADTATRTRKAVDEMQTTYISASTHCQSAI